MNRALLALLNPINANGVAQLLPAGEFSARDGRPGPGKTWKLNDLQGMQLAAKLNSVAALSPISIDYEHQSIHAIQNGQPAPAAGYMTSFEWRTGLGLFAKVAWTKRALEFIRNGEYRYISPVILFDQTGQVTGLHNAALVSTPALVNMAPVQAQAAAMAALSASHGAGVAGGLSAKALAAQVLAYQADRQASGVYVTTVQALDHISGRAAALRHAHRQEPGEQRADSLAAQMLAYQAERQAMGVHVTTVQAFRHVASHRS